MAPPGSGCTVRPNTVATKTANRYHDLAVIPAGAGTAAMASPAPRTTAHLSIREPDARRPSGEAGVLGSDMVTGGFLRRLKAAKGRGILGPDPRAAKALRARRCPARGA